MWRARGLARLRCPGSGTIYIIGGACGNMETHGDEQVSSERDERDACGATLRAAGFAEGCSRSGPCVCAWRRILATGGLSESHTHKALIRSPIARCVAACSLDLHKEAYCLSAEAFEQQSASPPHHELRRLDSVGHPCMRVCCVWSYTHASPWAHVTMRH